MIAFAGPDVLSGMILMWSGSVATIPNGFHLCDGTAGTPDLRDRFVVGSGTTYNPGDNGGAINHSHAFTGDGHNHDLGTVSPMLANDAANDIFTTTDPAVGDTNNADGRPPYYSLAYIMKL